MFIENIKTFFKRRLRLPRVYFARSIKDVEGGAIIFFPVYESRLNCGLTGIVAYKKVGSAPKKIPMATIESVVLHMGEYSLKKLEGAPGFAEHYLGGEDSIKELQDLVLCLKAPAALYALFKDESLREKIDDISQILRTVIV